MPAIAPMPVLPEVTVPLSELVPRRCRHYFNPHSGRGAYRVRCYDFGSSVQFMPLVRAFLDTCADHRDTDYRYLFTLLGSELANNALCHSRSGEPFGTYTLRCVRRRDGLQLTCHDQGSKAISTDFPLTAAPDGLNPDAESGRGLAMVDALATDWGDNGVADFRQVWFFLAYDLAGSRWNSQP
ncbi:ATP-binding protein [Nocardiopsis aegyptia]|uniref:Anti-sigma regulatory factor (Ser/Thr protein kinase) n=1 Tax=Nocardiopsis aegyptia TaxID=220378 RepID=A0A7Z0J964_9ACTN|nr:ATP-binding protein [Nocardiopsis aegyptia]NYJ33030.1 anti-sigma regulatory factor (Ser/Thr protein kinase) [Nocardiopsis aegyptia]